MDAGARGRRLLQRREYRAKVSEFIPKELEDQFSHDKNGQLVFELDLKATAQRVTQGLKNWWNKPVIDNRTKNQHLDKIKKSGGDPSHWQNSYNPEGEMIEANSAQMKAMQNAQLKKKEDDKVASKKKDVKEGTKYGLYKGSGKASGAFKDYLDKKKKEKESKKEEVELEAKKSCGEGEYYCYDDQKCKSIPEGMKVGKDGMLVKEDMKGMSQKSGDKRSTESGAGMTAKGVAKYNRRTGGNLKTAVTTPPSKLKPGSKAAKRRKSFCARSKSWDGPRGKAARRRWNCSYEPELPMIIDEKKKLFNTAPLSTRVSNWSKNIKEASPLTPGRNPLTGLPNLKSIEKKIKNSKTNRMNTGGDGTASRLDSSYIPQGKMTEDFYRKKYTVKDGYKKTDKMTKSNKRSGDSKAQYRELHKDLRKYKLKKLKTEGSLHKWFKGSKSKDGKPGWVNVVTGGTCASDKPGEGTPKCVSSSKRASMTKAERLSASRRKKKADPGQQSKSGAAKPTYVATDSKKK